MGFGLFELRQALRSRHDTAAFEIVGGYQTQEIRRAMARVMNLPLDADPELINGDPELLSAALAVDSMCEAWGSMAFEGIIDLHMLDRMAGGQIRGSWVRLRRWVEQQRAATGNLNTGEWWQWVYDRAMANSRSWKGSRGTRVIQGSVAALSLVPRRSFAAKAPAVAVALLLLVIAAQTALGYVTVETTGRSGTWSVADASAGASLRCTYQDQNLARLTISPPRMNAIARRKRLVGWQFEVWRAKWWQTEPDQWYLAYSSDIAKATSTRTRAATFTGRDWLVPAEFRTAYDSVKVRLILHWYAKNKVTEIGHTTVELEYYGLEEAGQPFDPASSTYAGHCPGSQEAPQRPEPGVMADVPTGFVLMSHWRPYWKGFDESDVERTIAELTRMHQTGVVLTGMESGSRYALPADVARYLGMFREAGIEPYLALWVGKFNDAETATSIRAWQAGDGHWAGIILDVERGLEVQVETDRSAAIQAVGRYMARIRPLTTFLAYSTFAIPTDHPDMLFGELNSYCDAYLPQLYFRTDQTALYLLDRMRASVDYESASWPEPPKPIVPVVNDWGDGVDLTELNNYIEISFARYGAVSGWRLHPNMHEEVKDLWGTFP